VSKGISEELKMGVRVCTFRKGREICHGSRSCCGRYKGVGIVQNEILKQREGSGEEWAEWRSREKEDTDFLHRSWNQRWGGMVGEIDRYQIFHNK